MKGRCSSKALNSELVRSIPSHLGSDLYGSYMYFPSSANRADGPTRGVPPAAPDMAPPAWWAMWSSTSGWQSKATWFVERKSLTA